MLFFLSSGNGIKVNSNLTNYTCLLPLLPRKNILQASLNNLMLSCGPRGSWKMNLKQLTAHKMKLKRCSPTVPLLSCLNQLQSGRRWSDARLLSVHRTDKLPVFSSYRRIDQSSSAVCSVVQWVERATVRLPGL